MILKTDRLRYESLKMTHNELCFMSIQLQIRSRRHLPRSTQNTYLYTFEIIAVFALK